MAPAPGYGRRVDLRAQLRNRCRCRQDVDAPHKAGHDRWITGFNVMVGTSSAMTTGYLFNLPRLLRTWLHPQTARSARA